MGNHNQSELTQLVCASYSFYFC